MLEGPRVVPYFYQWGEEGEENFWVVMIDLFPYEVGNLVGPGAEEGEDLERV